MVVDAISDSANMIVLGRWNGGKEFILSFIASKTCLDAMI